MTSKTTSSIWKRSWRSSSRGVRAPSDTAISPSLARSPWRRRDVTMQTLQGDAELEQRLHLLGVELERPLERLQRLGVPLVVEQRAPEEQQRQQVVRVLLEHLGQAHDRLPHVPRASQQIRERQRRLVERRQRVERALVRLPGLAPGFLLLVEPSQVEPHLDVAAIELQRRPVRGERAGLVADLERDVSLQLVEVGAAGGAGLRLLQRGERSGGVASGGAPLRRGDERVHVVRRELEQLLRQRARLLPARAAQGEQRLDLAEPRVGAPGLEAACLAVALERLAVQAALREDIAEQHARLRAARTPLHGAHGLGGRDVHQPLADVIARQGERVVRGLAGWRLGGGGRGRELLEDVVEQALVEVEVLAERLRRHVGRNLGGDPDRALLVLEVDRQANLWDTEDGLRLNGRLGGGSAAAKAARFDRGNGRVESAPT